MANARAVKNAVGYTSYFWQDPAGHCVRRQNPNGTLAYFSYDEVGRVASLRNLKGDLSPICYFDYSYDDAGLVTSIAREGGVAIYYGYDAASRLTGETWQGPAGTLYAFAYGYDPAGNRAWTDIGGTLTYYTYDPAERLLHEVTDGKYTYYTHDKNGSCVRIQAPDEGKYTYFEYSDARLLRSAHVLPDDRWNYFRYDGSLTRYCIEDSLGCQYYYWDGLKLLERDNLTTGAGRTFTHGHAPIAGIANMVEYAQGDDAYDFHYDIRGTVHGITDAEQEVAQTYEHDAWGVKLSQTGILENPIQYRGCAWIVADPLASPTFLPRLRAYDSSLARFLQKGTQRLAFSNPYATSTLGEKDPCERLGYPKGVGKYDTFQINGYFVEWCCVNPSDISRPPDSKWPPEDHRWIAALRGETNLVAWLGEARATHGSAGTCKPSDLPPSAGEQGTSCGNALAEARMNEDVRSLRRRIDAQKEKYAKDKSVPRETASLLQRLCTVVEIECRCCSASENPACWRGASLIGEVLGPDGSRSRTERFLGWGIYLCQERTFRPEHARVWLLHELTHVLQRCTLRPDETCRDRMKLEIEAYAADGSGFTEAFEGAVIGSCMTNKCTYLQITYDLARYMYNYYLNMLGIGKWYA